MKLLHTSDRHIGRALYGRKRYEEFEAFLDWPALRAAAYDHDAGAVIPELDSTETGETKK